MMRFGSFTLAVLLLLRMSGYSEDNIPSANRLRTTILVQMRAEPAWQDMAYLSAIPSAIEANSGAPSLICYDPKEPISPEIKDYLRRYRPGAVIFLGNAPADQVIAGCTSVVVNAVSADESACALSKRFWQNSKTAVICPEDDYEAGLLAAPLAAQLHGPLLFAGKDGLSSLVSNELQRLKSDYLVVVGDPAEAMKVLKRMPVRVTQLVTARDAISWAKKRGLSTRYLAAVNPLDRTRTVIKKLSLAGALLAAGRNGLVVPLSYEVQWKLPFNGEVMKGELPADLPKPEAKPKAGRIVFGKREYPFILTGNTGDHNLKLNIDLNGDGIYAGAGEGPFKTGDSIELEGKRHALTLGTENGAGKADVRLTWPRAERVANDLRSYYQALNVPPEYLCLVGFPDAVPQEIFGSGNSASELNSDLPYANVDDDPFAEICVSRVIAENASFATLYASRVLTYASLLDPEWQDRAGMACWENTYGNMFENVGFDEVCQHTEKDLDWEVSPAKGKKGKRMETFGQDSHLTRCAVIAHMNHSWWHELGGTFGWNANVLLAPVVIESGGCLTAALDREDDYHSVVARLLRKGAVSFSGNAREGIAESELQRHEFWNGVLSGLTIGQAHLRSMNSAIVTILDKKQSSGGGYLYQLRIRTQFGDPAFAMHVPSRPRSEPARCVSNEKRVTVYSPERWWPVKMHVPADWKKWADRDLYVLRGAGVYVRRTWCGDEYDKEEPFVTAEFTTRKHVVKIEQVQKPPAPLGWNGSFYEDDNHDGTRTYRWSVRLADFDQVQGKMVDSVKKLEYRVTSN